MGKHLAVPLLLLIWFCGCEEGSGICYELNKCAAAPPQCELYFEALILPGGCEEAIIDADCEDHHQDPLPYADLCFPPCGEDSAVCSGDIVTACYAGRTTSTKCPETCKLANATYTGVCDNEFEGQPSKDGQDVCWCE
jgi:hypothetical protein